MNISSILKTQSILIIGNIWLEETSGAGTRLTQLIEQFLKFGFTITFASASEKTENSKNLGNLGIAEQKISLNSSSFDEFITELNPDIVLFDRFMVEEQYGWRVGESCPNALKILDTEDLHFLRKTREECLKADEPVTKEKLLNSKNAIREIASILRSDLSLIISEYEVDLLVDTFKIDPELLLHIPFLASNITEEEVGKLLTYEEKEHFLFVGNYLHKPNVDAVLELKKIWKDIKVKLPLAEIHLYGAYPTQQIQQLHNKKEGFLVKGYIDDIQTEVKKARVILTPLRFGAGIKAKLLEAMQNGTPSVTTTIGAEGMHSNLAWNGIISSIDDFAENAVNLYQNKELWDTSVANGVKINNELYSKEIIGYKFIFLVQKMHKDLKEYRTKNFLGRLLQHQTVQSTKYMSKWIEEKNK